MSDPAPSSFNAGRLVLVFIGLSVAVVAGWLLLTPRPEIIEVEAPPADPQPLNFYLARADVARGEAYFARCSACHTIEQGGREAVGPNLWGVMGQPLAARPTFNYSPALREHGGTWDWATTNDFLHSPRHFAPGTKMTFAGVSDPQNRADVMLYMNSRGGRLTPPAR